MEQHEHKNNIKNESAGKTEELSEEKFQKGENQNQEKEEIHSDINENENNQEHESENENMQENLEQHENLEEHDYHLEGKIEQNENKNESENSKNVQNVENVKDDNQSMTEKDIVHHSNNENENENEKEKIEKNEKIEEKNEKKNEENEEELAKEEERDEMMDMNENEEEEAIPSYLSPTICFQYKQRQVAQPKPKPEFSDFDTTYKRKDKNKEFVEELHEEVVNHLNINQNNQKYLPKDYYDNPNGENFGERLYHKQTRLKEETMKKIRNKIERENKVKEDNLTFTPKINDYNIIALQNRIKNKQQYNNENKIIHYKDYLMGRENKIKCKYDDPENTFMPKIDRKSRKMTEGKTSDVPRYEILYKIKVDKKKLEEKIYDDKNMFKPKTNKNYKPGKAGKSENKKMIEYASLTFEERQKKFVEKVEEKREKLKEQKNTNIDVKTGKKYFKPTINENKKLDEKRKNKPIYIELYSDSAKYKIKKEELEKKVLELEQYNTEFKASERSEELYDKQKNIAFEKVFKRLDSDKDGKISKNKMDLFGISKRILKIITPILDELKEGKGEMSMEEFVKKCEKIYGNLNYADKKELFIYTMGGAIKSVYDTEPFRRKQVQKKSKGKTVRNTSRTNNLKNKNFLKESKQKTTK